MDAWDELSELLRQRGTAMAGQEETDRGIVERFQVHRGLFALDSSGFTRRAKAYGIVQYLALIVAMRDLIEELFSRFDVDQTWTYADNYFATFPSPSGAVDAALDLHRALQKRNAALPDPEQHRVCIAIGSGVVLRAGREGVFGDEMNVTSRLGEDVAAPGETLVTCHATAELRERTDLAFEPRHTVISDVRFDYYAVTPASR